MFIWRQTVLLQLCEIKITERNAHKCQDVAGEWSNCFVIRVRIAHQNDVQNDGQENDEDEVEEEEGFEVEDDLVDHGDNIAEVHENLHEIECLHQ